MKPLQKRRVQAQRKFAQGAYIFMNNNIPPKTDVSPAAVKDGPSKEDRNVIHNRLSAKNLLDVVSFQNLHAHFPVVLVERLSPNFEAGRETGSKGMSVGSGVHRTSGGRDLAIGSDASSGREGKRSTSPNTVSSTSHHIRHDNDSRALTSRLEPNHIKNNDTRSIVSRSTLVLDALGAATQDQNISKTERFIADCELGRTKRVPRVELSELDWVVEAPSRWIIPDTSEKRNASERSSTGQSVTRSEVHKPGTRRSVSQDEMRRSGSKLSITGVGSTTSDRFRSTRAESRFSTRSSENVGVGSSERFPLLDRYKRARVLKKRTDVGRSKAAPSALSTKIENGLRLRSRLLKKPLKLKAKEKPTRKHVAAQMVKQVKKNIARKKSEKKNTKRCSPSKCSGEVGYNWEDERPLKYFKVNSQNRTALQAIPEPGPSTRVTRSASERALATKPSSSRAPSTSRSSQDGECFKHPDLPIRFAKSNQNTVELEAPVPTPSPPVPPGPPPPSAAPSPAPSHNVVATKTWSTPSPNLSPTSPNKKQPSIANVAESTPKPSGAKESFYNKFAIQQWITTAKTPRVDAPITSPTKSTEATVSRSNTDVTVRPTDKDPARSADKVPARLTNEVPEQPTHTAPMRPIDDVLVRLTDKVPAQLTNKVPVQPTDEVPKRPTDKVPEQPEDSSAQQTDMETAERVRPKDKMTAEKEKLSAQPTENGTADNVSAQTTGMGNVDDESAQPADVSTRPRPRLTADKPTTSRTASPCPSESIITIKDVVRAPKGKLDNRCKCCMCCHRVNTVTQIANVFAKDMCTNDVYEFNTESDGATQPVGSYRQHGSRAQDEEDNHIYLDLLPAHSPHIIQMTKGKTNKMSARLVPRSDVHPTQDLKLIEHENLLEQLLRTLSKGTDISITNKPNTKQKAKIGDGAKLVEAPIYKLEESDFNDPIKFFEKIMPIAAKYGLCKVVAPDNFKPTCVLADMLKFKVTNHYIARLYSRWGSAAREMSAMKAYLATQNVTFNRVPLLESLEVNLPKLYAVVQRNGGLKQVLEKKRWGRVAEEMRFNKGPNTEKMLDTYYVKYLLPYDTASNQERQKIISTVEKCWNKKYRKLLEWAMDPLHHQKKLLGESDSSDEEMSDGDSDDGALHALSEAEDCIVAGRPMNLNGFKKVAKHASDMFLPRTSATPSVTDIENEYWRLVLFGSEHVCVNAASIDTESGGYGFSKSRQDPFGRHPWNLKMLSSNPGNVLRSLSKVIGVTVPTLHLGMIFSTSCWHRDPHGLPWVEYMHEGPAKIWYGIPDEQSGNFRRAVEALCPTSCQNKSIWLSSDITMIPPNLLREHNVSLSRAVQNPGEYIIVFPKAYSCSISTGFTVSESVYFATHSWLKQVHEVFSEVRDSCEPTTFSLEQLLIALSEDPRASLAVLQTVQASLTTVINEELRHRARLAQLNVKSRIEPHKQAKRGRSWNARDHDECQICRSSLFLSKVVGLLGKKTPVCLLHALRLLDTPKYKEANVASMELVVFYTQKRLEDIVANTKKRIV